MSLHTCIPCYYTVQLAPAGQDCFMLDGRGKPLPYKGTTLTKIVCFRNI